MNVLKNCSLRMWGLWSNFINKINEKIEFELRNTDEKLKIQLSEEDKL